MSEKDENRTVLTRRVFMGGLVSAATVSAFGLAGCSPRAAFEQDGSAANVGTPGQTQDPNKAVWPAIEELDAMPAGKGESAYIGEDIPESEIVHIYDVDVVVCGLGPAGDAAALSCAEQGLKTVAVEKRTVGNYNSATLGGTDSKVHKHWGISFDKKEWLNDALTNSSYHGDQVLYQAWLDNNGEAVDWYISHFEDQNLDHYPLTFAAGDFPAFRDQWDEVALSRSWNTMFNLPVAVPDLPGKLAGYIAKAGGEIRYSCPACKLVFDNGKVTGVIVKSADGYERYDCSKGVILATGGYEFNLDMLKARCRPRDLAIGGWLTASTANTGDGHQMGLEVGALEDEYPQALMLDPEQLMPYLRVNGLGKRFTPEYEAYNHVAMAIQSQPKAYCYYIVDGGLATKIDKIWTPSSSPYGPKQTWIGAATGDNALKADTLEELAEKMGVPKDAFVETIGRWNKMAAAGEDTDFHFPGKMMMTIDTPPYYATKEMTLGLCTVGGLQVNVENAVLDIHSQPIGGLYATGLTAGSMYYNTYQHNLNGLSHTRNITDGYLLGKMLAKK